MRIKWKSIILCWKFQDVPRKVPALETGAYSPPQEYKKICESTVILMGPTESKPESWYHYWHGHVGGFAFESSMVFPALFLSELLVNNWRHFRTPGVSSDLVVCKYQMVLSLIEVLRVSLWLSPVCLFPGTRQVTSLKSSWYLSEVFVSHTKELWNDLRWKRP